MKVYINQKNLGNLYNTFDLNGTNKIVIHINKNCLALKKSKGKIEEIEYPDAADFPSKVIQECYYCSIEQANEQLFLESQDDWNTLSHEEQMAMIKAAKEQSNIQGEYNE